MNRLTSRFHFALLLALLMAALPLTGLAAPRMSLSLAGEWNVRLDPQDQGLQQAWSERPLKSTGKIRLPSTTDLAGLGFALNTTTLQHAAPFPETTRFPGVEEPLRADEHGYLVRRHLFVGPAWYEREFKIPAHWKDRRVTLRFERAMWQTSVWLDGNPVGSRDSLVAEHRYDLGMLAPGKHRLTVRVDNRLIHNISTVTHSYGPETQSRWNGLVGKLSLEAVNNVSIKSVTIFPAADRLSASSTLILTNGSGASAETLLRVRIFPEHGSKAIAESATRVLLPKGNVTNQVRIDLKTPAEPWDEFHPIRYRLAVTLEQHDRILDRTSEKFGFRHIERVANEIHLNGKRIFLRGTLDCCVYPDTGHPPTTVSEWERVLRVIRDHGFNHVRYHTWCPPEAAFEAADRLGLYLQPETPAWVDDWVTGTITKPGGLGHDPEVWAWLRAEAARILETYGNHPSFLMFTVGNEFADRSTDWPAVNSLVAELKVTDPRRLYSGCTARRRMAADDYWITHNSGASARGVGPARTDWDFADAAQASPVPVIAHETGQRPVFPHYATLLPKFRGPLAPLNLERLRNGLAANGLETQVSDFVRASARFQLTQYKAEHEAMLRTRGYAGYQLLMLNDFTGQSEALVGILDPFWESKGVIAARDVRRWNAPTVLLARFHKYIWTTNETFRAELEVAHYGPADMRDQVLHWKLQDASGHIVGQGNRPIALLPKGGLAALDSVSVPLAAVKPPAMLTLSLRLDRVENRWDLWAYPPGPEEPVSNGVLVTRILDDVARDTLRQGGKVLLLAHGLKNPRTARTGFESVYWSAGWWGNVFSSLGILCDPGHPALTQFPNEGCSDWQWKDLCAGATTFLLDDAPPQFRPIIQPVPDFHYHRLLAHVFEGKVGPGKLLVCGYDLQTDLPGRPAAAQFRRSLFRYAGSAAFRPARELPPAWLEQVLSPAGLARHGAKILRANSEDSANGNLAAHAIDGDPSTFWHTRWQPKTDAPPHEIVVDLGRELDLKGISCLPRQDQANGRIAQVEIYCSSDPNHWGQPQATATWPNTAERQKLVFPSQVKTRFLKIVAISEVAGNSFAALAELDLIQ